MGSDIVKIEQTVTKVLDINVFSPDHYSSKPFLKQDDWKYKNLKAMIRILSDLKWILK